MSLLGAGVQCGQEQHRPTVLVVTGPTASGKSKLALSLAQRYGGEILNADSVQFYQGFDIGAAKPSAAEFELVPHHLYSFLSGDEAFTAGDFCLRAGKVISELQSRGVVPIITGGSGLYIRALLCGLVEAERGGDEAEEQIDFFVEERVARGLEKSEVARELHSWLAAVDPGSAAQLHPTDTARVRRALEVHLSSGVSLAALQEHHRSSERPYRALVVCCLPEREKLYAAIDRRVEEMLEAGLVQEVRSLLGRFPATVKPLSAIGYRHVRLFLEGALEYEAMVELLKRDTRRFAKRQYTWWRNQPERLGWRLMSRVYGEEGISDAPHRAIEEFLMGEGPFSRDFSAESVAFLPVPTVEWAADL